MIKAVFHVFLIVIIVSCANSSESKRDSQVVNFNLENDLLLVNYDCKTDVDDLHSIAAFASLIRQPEFSKLNFHAVAGAYGIQEGEYVPGNSLFNLAFSDRWSDAHLNHDKALNEVFVKVANVLSNDGNIWIAEAGQSDFSSKLVMKIQEKLDRISTTKRIHVVQHSDWNEEVTDPAHLANVKKQTDYHKIPDGNALNNGTPGFNSSSIVDWTNIITNQEIKSLWDLAIQLADTYNGEDGRYLNESIKAGGLDFSDFSEVHHILSLENIENCTDYFEYLASQN